MKLKEFGPPGGRASKILLCRSATAFSVLPNILLAESCRGRAPIDGNVRWRLCTFRVHVMLLDVSASFVELFYYNDTEDSEIPQHEDT